MHGGKHPRHPKYLPHQEIFHKSVEKKKYSNFMTNSVFVYDFPYNFLGIVGGYGLWHIVFKLSTGIVRFLLPCIGVGGGGGGRGATVPPPPKKKN